MNALSSLHRLPSAAWRLSGAVLAGLLMVPAFAPFDQFWLAPLALLALLALAAGCSPRQALATGYAFGVGCFSAGVYWVYISMHNFGGAPAPLAAVMTVALVACLAVYPALVLMLLARFWPRPDPLRHLLAFPVLWGLSEWLRGWLFSGFGWLGAGYSQIDTPLAGYAPLAGVVFMGLLVALNAGVLWQAWWWRRQPLRLALAASLLVGIWSGGAALERVQWSQPTGTPLSVALIQGNVSQDKKWAPEMRRPTLERYRELTLAHLDRDLIIWPEAALPVLLNHVPPEYMQGLNQALRRHGSDLLMGILMRDYEQDLEYNTIMAAGDPPQFYFKHHLVPFGEFFPVPGFVRRQLALLDLPYTGFERGPSRQSPLLVADGVAVAASICYEDLFGGWFAGTVPGAELLVNVSNDAWFGASIAPAQHLQIARMRALENARMMLRATNTGITAIIGTRGEVVARLGQFETGVLAGEVTPHAGRTPYTRWRDWPLLVLLLAGLGVAGGVAWRQGWSPAAST